MIELKYFNFIKNTGAQTTILIGLYLALANTIPIDVQRLFYTISLAIKDLLIGIMPIIIAAFISSAVYSFKGRALLFIISIVLFEFFSNFICVWYSFGTASVVANYFYDFKIIDAEISFEPLWRFSYNKPVWYSADKGVAIGAILGYIAVITDKNFLVNSIEKTREIMNYFLTKILARLMPIFILGFITQTYHTDLLGHIFVNYTSLILILIIGLIVYIFALFFIGANLNFSRAISHVNNLLPAAFVALTSGCSLSTMPFTIEGTAKNLIKPEFAASVIPATTNIQQVGDILTNCFLCFLIYHNFYDSNPSLDMWLYFSFIFVLTRFATVGVRGGATFLMLPIYEKYLHFTPEMIAIILALNVILDPIITSANVIGNGALCKLFERIWLKY